MELRSGIFLYINLLIKLNVLNQEPRKRNAHMHGLDDSCRGGAIDNKIVWESLFMYVLAYNSNIYGMKTSIVRTCHIFNMLAGQMQVACTLPSCSCNHQLICNLFQYLAFNFKYWVKVWLGNSLLIFWNFISYTS